jgi:uncharacterized membrane protein
MTSGRLRHSWERIRTSLWFVPALLAISAIALAFAVLAFDRRATGAFLADISWIHARTASGARDLLGVVAGSMITIAGLTFSIVIVALQLASVQLGPRLMRNFMRDTGNQVVLGTFIATFLYCLIIMRAIDDDGPASPRLAVVVALLLALLSLAVLIYFIHHTAESIQAPRVIARVFNDLEAAIDRLYPEPVGTGEPRESAEHLAIPPSLTAISSTRSGYLQRIDESALMAAAHKADVVVRLQIRPGDFVLEGSTIAMVAPAHSCDDGVIRELRRSCIIGSQRSAEQDIDFVMSRLVEIALRALSSSRNDVFTAMTCIDYQSAGLVTLAGRRFPSPVRRGTDGHVRVIAEGPDLTGLIGRAFDDLVALGVSFPSVDETCLAGLDRIRRAVANDDESARQAIDRHAAIIEARVRTRESIHTRRT